MGESIGYSEEHGVFKDGSDEAVVVSDVAVRVGLSTTSESRSKIDSIGDREPNDTCEGQGESERHS